VDSSRTVAVGLGAGLVAYSATAGRQVPGRHHPLVQAALGSALAVATRAPVGLHGAALRSGMRWGGLSAALVSATVAVTTAIPPVHVAMDRRVLPRPRWKWLTVDIPLGTVWSEEAAYRGALATVATTAFGAPRGRLVQAVFFGLSHVVDARGTGEPVLGTVLVTGLAGWIFGWLAGRSGSLVAPALAHAAINESGALAAMAVQRRAAARITPNALQHKVK
jgi:uncharacterized protein